ncbi:MAG: SWIM zinc finger family protein [Nitrospirota bacterium]
MKLQDIKEKDIRNVADSAAVLQRGIDYFHNRMVNKIWLEDDTICAKVSGSQGDYDVEVWCENDTLRWRCNCPYDGGGCKHVVATICEFMDKKKELFDGLQEQTQKATLLEEQLKKLPQNRLIEIIMELLKKNKKGKAKLLEMLGKYFEDNGEIEEAQKEVQEDIYIEQYEEYWSEADPILHDFNEYGGGAEEDEEIVYDNIDKIVALFKEEKLSQDIKIEFIDNLFYYYDLGNSGFGDYLMDSIFSVATGKSDWEYVIEKLRAKESNYRKSLIMTIYKKYLHDNEAYLKEREAKLHYGMGKLPQFD